MKLHKAKNFKVKNQKLANDIENDCYKTLDLQK